MFGKLENSVCQPPSIQTRFGLDAERRDREKSLRKSTRSIYGRCVVTRQCKSREKPNDVVVARAAYGGCTLREDEKAAGHDEYLCPWILVLTSVHPFAQK